MRYGVRSIAGRLGMRKDAEAERVMRKESSWALRRAVESDLIEELLASSFTEVEQRAGQRGDLRTARDSLS